MKPSVTKVKVRGRPMWRVRWREFGRVKRAFYGGRDAADARAALLRGESTGIRQRLALVDPVELAQMLAVWEDAKARGIDLRAALDASTPQASPPVRDVLAEMIALKRQAKKSERYLTQLSMACGAFVTGRESTPIANLVVSDIEAFLESKQQRSRPTLRARLSTLFKFAVRRGFRPDNPCERLESVALPYITPSTLTVKEASKCLRWLKKNPRSMAWFALSAFAGLRPEEAERTLWDAVNFEEGWIRVEAQTSKMRQRRVVYPLPAAMLWLKFAKDAGALLPLPPWAARRDRRRMAQVIKWESWKKDCTRHTAASMWLAMCGSAATVATALGHSEKILRKNYMALVTKGQAEAYWGLVPPGRKGS